MDHLESTNKKITQRSLVPTTLYGYLARLLRIKGWGAFLNLHPTQSAKFRPAAVAELISAHRITLIDDGRKSCAKNSSSFCPALQPSHYRHCLLE
ncbi:hypothetical protein [Pseudomonas sp.]|uniref:hypothetical protein n=1 Tax=Pseudomonas sp. TaxID=306 RepID=UPI002601AB81|nr:hypothetical protein [Pseudomonas sp.]